MCCVSGMLEETSRKAAGHGFESNERTRIYPSTFFLRGVAFSIGNISHPLRNLMPELSVPCQILCRKHHNSISREENDIQTTLLVLTRHNSHVDLSPEVPARQCHHHHGRVRHMTTIAIRCADLSRVDQTTSLTHGHQEPSLH